MTHNLGAAPCRGYASSTVTVEGQAEILDRRAQNRDLIGYAREPKLQTVAGCESKRSGGNFFALSKPQLATDFSIYCSNGIKLWHNKGSVNLVSRAKFMLKPGHGHDHGHGGIFRKPQIQGIQASTGLTV